MNLAPIAVVVVGLWLLINGILHDIFVLRSEYGKVYNRELLRLLMDGHVLISCGIILLFCYKDIQQNQAWAYYVAITVCSSMLVYCAMIFPFLKSFVTILLNATLIVILLIAYFKYT